MLFVYWDKHGAPTFQQNVEDEAWNGEERTLTLTLTNGKTVKFGPNNDTEYPDDQQLPVGKMFLSLDRDLVAVTNYVFDMPPEPDVDEPANSA